MNVPLAQSTQPLRAWTWSVRTRAGDEITIRPLRADDEQRETEFVSSLSDEARYFRMLTPLRCLSPQLLKDFMDVDYDRRMALVATIQKNGVEQFVGVARYGPTEQRDVAEFGISVLDAWQRRGVATVLIRALMRFAITHGFHRFTGVVLPENVKMLALARSLGFQAHYDAAEHLMHIDRQLAQDKQTRESACELGDGPG